MDQQTNREGNPRRLTDSEAEELRALLRRPPLMFYGQLEDEARQRCGKVISRAKRGRKSKWMI